MVVYNTRCEVKCRFKGQVVNNNWCYYFATSVLLVIFGGIADGNILLNPSFETGSGTPNSWSQYGSGTFIWNTSDVRSGSKSAELGGSSFMMLYQRVSGASEGQTYRVSTWVKFSSGGGSGTLKLEYHGVGNPGTKLQTKTNIFTASGSWTEISVTDEAPPDTDKVTIAVVGENGGFVLFDDASIEQIGGVPDTVTFDISNTSHEFMGFGAHIWGYGNTASYPKLESYRQQALQELNIKYVRIENHNESASTAAMQRTRAVTDDLGIDWIYMTWIAWCCMDGSNMLNNIGGFADFWVSHVANLYSNGMPVEYIELMNEPDSGGVWSTGITFSDYNLLVKDLRPKLDTAGLSGVGIVGAGPASITVCDDYINALDVTGIASMAAWSTHSWGSADGLESESRAALYLTTPGDAADPTLPKFVTEYATHETTFHGITTDPGDNYGIWDVTEVFPYYATSNRQPYAVRTYENTLGLLNGGANAPFIWQLNDEPTETITGSKRKSWGGLDLWGDPKPVYGALKTLYPKIPVGAMVVTPPNQSSNSMYTGAFVDGSTIVIGISNESSSSKSSTITLTNAPTNLMVREALAFEPIYWGVISNGDPDVGRIFYKNPNLVQTTPGVYTLDVTLVGDSTLTVVLGPRPGDLDDDNGINLGDFVLLGLRWLDVGCGGCSGTELSGDGNVNLDDVKILAGRFLTDLEFEAHFKLDGDTADSSFYDRATHVAGSPVWESGKIGSAVRLDGIDDFFMAPGYFGIDGTGARTCAAWVKLASLQTGDIIGWGRPGPDYPGGKWLLHVQNTSGQALLRVAVNSGWIMGTTDLNDGAWHHVAAVWEDDGTPDISDAKLYIDGVEETTTVSARAIDTFADMNVRIGFFRAGYINGWLDDVRIYNRALSEIEVQGLESMGE